MTIKIEENPHLPKSKASSIKSDFYASKLNQIVDAKTGEIKGYEPFVEK